ALLEPLGYGVRRKLTAPGFGVVDGVAGAALSAAVALGLAWLAGAVALQAPQTRGLRDDIQRSSILRALNDLLPPSGPILNALARFDPPPPPPSAPTPHRPRPFRPVPDHRGPAGRRARPARRGGARPAGARGRAGG